MRGRHFCRYCGEELIHTCNPPPYLWRRIVERHSYKPYKTFTTYALIDRRRKTMFGYVQKYQSLTGYKCFEKPIRFVVYKGNKDRALSESSCKTLREAKAELVEMFMESKDE